MNYSGNIRLENERRDLGQLHFAFAPEFTEWKAQEPAVFKIFTEADFDEMTRDLQAGKKTQKLTKFNTLAPVCSKRVFSN